MSSVPRVNQSPALPPGSGASGGGYDFLYAPRQPNQSGTGGSLGHSYESAGHSAPRNVTGGSLHDPMNGGSLGNVLTGGSVGRSIGSQHRGGGSGAATPSTPQSEHFGVLDGHADFLVPPNLTPVERATPANCRALFLGHMKFETTVAEVRWLLYTTVNVIAAKAEPRGNGCFVVYVQTDEEMDSVRSLHKRLLFDHHGVWFARNDEEMAYMNDYVDTTLARTRRRRLRLPKDCMVVEEPRSTPLAVNRASPIAHAAPPQVPQQPQKYPSAAMMAYGVEDDFYGGEGTNMYAQPAPTGVNNGGGQQYGSATNPAQDVYGGGGGGGGDALYDIPTGDDALYGGYAGSYNNTGAVQMAPPPGAGYQRQQ